MIIDTKNLKEKIEKNYEKLKVKIEEIQNLTKEDREIFVSA